MKNKIKEDVLFSSVFHHSPIGLIILNSDTTLEKANDYIFKYFHLSPVETKGKRFGNIFKCSSIAGTKLLCGQSEKCANCDLRNGVGIVLEKEKPLENVVIQHQFVIDGITETKWFKISASAVNIKGMKYAIVSFSDITRQKQYEELLKFKLSLDIQTGTLNKYTLIDILQNLLSENNDYKKVTISMTDFDDFKHFNDTYGHITGDKILEAFSTISFKNIRKSDILGRYGGEEFIFIFYETTLKKSVNILQRIQKDFKEYCIRETGEPLSFSSGIIEIDSKKLKKMKRDQIINYIDKYLYKAKKRGKGRVVSDRFELVF